MAAAVEVVLGGDSYATVLEAVLGVVSLPELVEAIVLERERDRAAA